jgi:hypothetical protein
MDIFNALRAPLTGQAGSGHARPTNRSAGFYPDTQRFDIRDSNPPTGHLNHSSIFQRLECTLDHLAYSPNHCRQLVLRISKNQAGRILDERGLPARVIAKQSGHPADNVAKREVFDNQFIGAKAGGEQSNDIEADVGVAPQKIEQVVSRKNRDRSVRNGDGICWKRLIIKYGNVGKRTARPEDFQHLLTTIHRRDRSSDAPVQYDEKPFASIALAEDHVAYPIVAFV